MLHSMLLERQRRFQELGLHAANERCASIDNTVADLLSRGDIKEALRHADGYELVHLDVDPVLRAF